MRVRLAIALVISPALGCAPAPIRLDSPPPVDGIVVIVADTLRADHLGLYGYGRDTSPNLDAWASDAVVFEGSVAQAGYTVASVSSMFTGLHPSAHGCCQVIDDGGGDEALDLLDGAETLAERFADAGYTTAALHKSSVFDRGGIDQGFELFGQVPGVLQRHESGRELTDAALTWLEDNQDAPFLLYVHYTDPHLPYQAPGEWYEQFDEGYASDLEGARGELQGLSDGAATSDDVERLRALYDGEIAYLDDQLARLLGALEDALAGRVAVAFTADHGEQFNEHGGWSHQDLWQENLNVPLVIKAPNVAPARVDVRTQTIDLAPTLAGLAGLSPASTWRGRDLSPILHGDPAPAADWILSEYGQRSALYAPDEMKLIRDRAGDRLYDLSVDPDEALDLASDRPDQLAEMQAKLDEMLALAAEDGERIQR